MSKKVTIIDIAKLANTSKTTVSYYLNQRYDKMSEDTRNRIEQAIVETNYKPNYFARSLSQHNSKLLCLIVSDIAYGFTNKIVKGVEKVASANGYKLIIGNSNYDKKKEAEIINSIYALGADGYIIQPSFNFKVEDHPALNKSKVVFIDSKPQDLKCNLVATDNYASVKKCTEAIIDKGYNAIINIEADHSKISTRNDRYLGLVDACNKKGINYISYTIDNDTNEEEIKTFVENHLKLNMRTAVFVANGWALPLVFNALKKYKHLIPLNLGIYGVDNDEWTSLSTPTITTIVQPAYKLGEEACKLLINSMDNDEYHEIELENKLNFQDSTNIKNNL